MRKILKKYRGIALNKVLNERGRTSGEIWFNSGWFVFANEQIRKDFPIASMKIEKKKMGMPLYYFSYSLEPDWTFYTSDKSIVNDKLLATNKDIIKIKSKNLRERVISSVVMFMVLCFVASLFIFGGTIKKSMVSATTNKVPIEWEVEVGTAVYDDYKSNVKMLSNSSLDIMMKDLTNPLISKIYDKRYPFTIHVAKDEEINAFAIMGGNVVINSGLIQFAKTPEEILGVLAHEIAHVQKRHSVSLIIDSLGLYTVVQLFFGDVTGIAAVFLDSGSFVITQSYSREFESDADALGLEYLVEANINPNGMIAFFENMQKEEESDKSMMEESKIIEKSMKFISSHPETLARIKKSKEDISKLPANKKNQKMDFDLDKLKELIKNLS